MSIRGIVSAVRRRIVLVLVTAVIAGGAGYAFAPHARVYRARATLYMGESALAYNPNTQQQDPLSVQVGELTDYTFSQLVSSPPTARFAVTDAGVDRSPELVAGETSAAPIPYTELITITVVDVDPQVAARLANAIPTALNQELAALDPASPGQVPPAPAVLYTPATPPSAPIRSSALGDALLAIPFGLVLAAIGAVVAELLLPTLASPAQVEAALGLPVLGSTRRRRAVVRHRRPALLGPRPGSPGRRRWARS